MSCFRDPSGKPLCHIVEHPDRPDESFCSTCRTRFQDIPNSSPRSRSDAGGQLPKAVVEIITGLLALFLAVVVNNVAKDSTPPLPPTAPPQTSIYNDA